MKYFKGATLKPASDFVHSENDFQFRGSDFLVASSGKYPLAIQINLNNGDSLYANNALCAKPAFKLKQVGDGQSDVICHLLPGNQKEYLYMYEFKSGGNKYLVLLVQYIKAFDNPPTDADEVKELTDKLSRDSELDLRNFKDDLQIILPSIKVVN
ncbi:hypothetical protein IPL68_00255 [Candidatus Saccharibacteria bacterium]|nr:MAG: hypothetical protein IPL68_00255 [Candidatus Saccharibacteria bacterium]